MDGSRRAADIDSGNERLLRSGEQIYDLVDVIHDGDIDEGQILEPADADGKIHDLVDVVEEGRGPPIMNAEFHDEMMRRISAMAEKIAREVIPDIAERVIREEIENLKKEL